MNKSIVFIQILLTVQDIQLIQINVQVDTLWSKIFYYEDSDKTVGNFVNLTSYGGI